MNNGIKCTFCDNEIVVFSEFKTNIYDIKCHLCGGYRITLEAYQDLPKFLNAKYKNEKHLICGMLAERYDLKLSDEIITRENFEAIYNSFSIPKDLNEKMDKIISYVYRKTDCFMQEIPIESYKYTIGYAKNEQEFKKMIEYLSTQKEYLQSNKIFYFLTFDGWERAEMLSRKVINSNQCFVAMWYTPEMEKIYSDFISPAIKEAEFIPRIIITKEHNNDINDEIIKEIRKSKFIIADLTGHRGGVYYEAGFAYGLGLEVIFSCREDWFNKEIDSKVEVMIDEKQMEGIIKEKRLIHFDINHKSFIIWKDGKELYDKLINRIKATIV